MLGTFRHAPVRRARVLALALALALGGCKAGGLGDITGSINGGDRMPTSRESLKAYAEDQGKRFEASPGDKAAAMNYARALKALTQYNQAAAVLQTCLLRHANDKELIAAYGKALADAGRFQEAVPVLASAHTPERPNWSVYNTQGSVADQLGNHDQAQAFYHSALEIEPGEPTVLSNLGLSFALSKDLARAEQTLRQASDSPRADARVRQNLALVLALQGKFSEAETLSRKDLSAEEARANVTAIRQMIAQSNTWREIQKLDGGKGKPGAAVPAVKMVAPEVAG